MSQRRLFSPDIVESDAFLDMPISSQALYFHLGMHADDDGFVNPKKIMRMIGSAENDIAFLIGKRFVLPFESGVVVIKHWLIHNTIRKDRYTETRYVEEKSMLQIKDNKSYTELVANRLPLGCQSGTLSKVKLSKVKSSQTETVTDVKDKPIKKCYGELQGVKLTDEERDKLIERLGEKAFNVFIFELDTYIASKGEKYKSHYATILNWAKRRVDQASGQSYQSKGRGLAQ